MLEGLSIPLKRGFYLDEFVRQEAPFNELTIDFIGENPEDALFARTRISPMYKNSKGMYGYLESSRHKDKTDTYFDILGIIEVPKKVLINLAEKDKKLPHTFARDFGIDMNTPDCVEIAPFHGINLPNDTYFVCYHPRASRMPTEPAKFKDTYMVSHIILAGYLSKMDQWVNHAEAGNTGKSKLFYQGMARNVGYAPRRLENHSSSNPQIQK
ncbi:hypothetical protein KW805_00885 [Candidatus Pacearchaeota archaeon]|nr:hypothetical protein [Candidatus Pacearchaeota archaeon]